MNFRKLLEFITKSRGIRLSRGKLASAWPELKPRAYNAPTEQTRAVKQNCSAPSQVSRATELGIDVAHTKACGHGTDGKTDLLRVLTRSSS